MEEDYKEMSVGQIRQEYHKGVQLVEEGEAHMSKARFAIINMISNAITSISPSDKRVKIDYHLKEPNEELVATWVSIKESRVCVEVDGSINTYAELLEFEDILGILNILMDECY